MPGANRLYIGRNRRSAGVTSSGLIVTPSGLFAAAAPTTQLLVSKNDFTNSGAWTLTGATITLNSGSDPNGGTAAQRMTASAGNTVHNVAQIVTGALDDYTFSVYAKAGTAGFLCIGINSGNYAVFNLSTGAVPDQQAGTGSTITYPNGWFKCVYLRPAVPAGPFPWVYAMGTSAVNAVLGTAWTAAGTETISCWNGP